MKTVKHRFVEYIPDKLEEGVVYVSTEYATASHLCCCGCKNEVVTPLSPTDWKVTYDGKTISLHPSIGNWGFACRSHYWITNNQVKWAERWSEEKIKKGREYDRKRKAEQYKDRAPQSTTSSSHGADAEQKNRGAGLLSKVKRWLP